MSVAHPARSLTAGQTDTVPPCAHRSWERDRSGQPWRCSSCARACARRSCAGRAEQAEELNERGENERYLPGVPLPRELKVRTFGGHAGPVPPRGPRLPRGAVEGAGARRWPSSSARGSPRGAGIVSLAKGLVPPDGTPPTLALEAVVRRRTAWPASAGPRTRARWRPRAPGSSAPRTRSGWPIGAPASSSAPASSARSRTTRSGSSWPGARRTRPRWRWARPRRRG